MVLACDEFFFLSDSFFISHQRPSLELEILEKRMLLEQGRSIHFSSSLVAYLLSSQFLKVLAPIIDWSSVIHDSSYVYETLIKPSPTLTAQVCSWGFFPRFKSFFQY